MIEAAYGGALIKAGGQAATIPVVAAFAAPTKCRAKHNLLLGGLKVAAAESRNMFEIGMIVSGSIRSDHPGECRARVVGSLSTGIPVSLASCKAGVWTFEYWSQWVWIIWTQWQP